MTFFSWIDDHLPKARAAMRRYCELLAMHGYGGGADDILREVNRMDKDQATVWVGRSFDPYITDEVETIRYLLHASGGDTNA